MSADDSPSAPARLQQLLSWQSGRVATIGARLTGRRMPLPSRGDYAVLAALDETGSLSQADLGRRLGLDRNDVNGILNRLQESGHVDREPDPTDRRRNVVRATQSGRAHLAELQAAADEVQRELTRGLSADEVQQLQRLLAAVLAQHGPQSA